MKKLFALILALLLPLSCTSAFAHTVTTRLTVDREQAKALFLRYDQQKLIEKLSLEADEDYLYPILLGSL